MAFLPLLAISTMDMNTASIGLVLSVYLMAEAGIQGFIGPLTDRFNKGMMLVIFGIATPALLLLIPYAHSGGALLAILLPMALLGATARASLLAVTVEAGKQHKGMGTVMGIFSSAGSLGILAGPTTSGYVMDAFGLNSSFITAGAVGIIGGLFTFYFFTRWAATLKHQAVLENTE